MQASPMAGEVHWSLGQVVEVRSMLTLLKFHPSGVLIQGLVVVVQLSELSFPHSVVDVPGNRLLLNVELQALSLIEELTTSPM